MPNWHHVMWKCRERPTRAPEEPENPIQRRYGWPTTGKCVYDKEVLKWMEFATERMWQQRHGTEAQVQRDAVEEARKSRRERMKQKEEQRRQESSTEEERD